MTGTVGSHEVAIDIDLGAFSVEETHFWLSSKRERNVVCGL